MNQPEAAPPSQANPTAGGSQPQPAVASGVAHGLAVASGVLYFLAFPGMNIWPLALVAWVPWLVAIRGRTTRQITRLSWLTGISMTFLGFYWVLELLQNFSSFSTPICLALMLLLSLYQGGRIALMGFLFGRATTRHYWRGPSFALAFAVSEFLFPLLFPWYFGATVHQVPLLTQVADLGNPIVVGLVLCASNYAIAELLCAHREKRPKPWRLAGALLGVLCVAVGYGALRLAQFETLTAEAPKGKIGLVQANMGLLEKRNNRNEGLRRHLRLSEELKAGGPLDLLVWSETSVAGAVYEHEAELVYRRLFTERLATPTLFGALLVRDVSDARKYTLFNSALMSDASGKLVGRYDKHKLLAFGEQLPLGDIFPILYEWSPNTGKFTPGTTIEPLPAGDLQISAHVCYEDVLPGYINEMFSGETKPDIIVNMTNDAWYGDTTQPWIHLALAQFRSIEHRRFLVRSTNSGVSAFVDATGQVLAHTETFREAALSHEVAYIEGARTPYELYGNTPWWLSSALIVLWGVVPRRRLQIALTKAPPKDDSQDAAQS